MKTILIFDTELSGHHLEYIHHLFIKGISSDEEYIYCIPQEFEVKKDNFLWNTNRNNVKFHFITNKLYDKIQLEKNYLIKSYYKSKLLSFYIKKFLPTHVFLIDLMSFLPFAILFVSNKAKISGIIYKIYLYRWNEVSWIYKIIDIIKNMSMSLSKCIHKIYILNDESSPKVLNKLYRTNKFEYLPDPFVPISGMDPTITREALKISIHSLVLLHFGSMNARKGTIEILKSIELLNKKKEITIIFAGKINEDIKSDFYRLYSLYKNKIQIILMDRFCSFNSLASLCLISDYLLMPYKETRQSSGVIGYAAQYKVPVIGPAQGLIGKLIRKYHLGLVLNDVSYYNIAGIINNITQQEKYIVSQKYLLSNNVNTFLSKILFD